MLILLAGPSGVGKNSVINELLSRRDNLKIMYTCTSRPPRKKDDGAFIHLSKEEFEKKIVAGEFFEYENVHADIFYGTPYSSLQKVIEGKEDYIKDIDVNGIQKLKKYLTGKVKVVTIFLDSPDAELRARLKKRGESDEMIDKRLSRAAFERSFKNKFDIQLDNDTISTTADQIEKAIFGSVTK